MITCNFQGYYDPSLLLLMGVEESGYDFRLPFYLRNQVSFGCDCVPAHVQPCPLSQQALSKVVLQVVSHPQFHRYVPKAFYYTLTLCFLRFKPALLIYITTLRLSPDLISFYIYQFRFICLPLMISGVRQAGPASEVFYQVPPHVSQGYPETNQTTEFRRELSLAYSKAYFLKPHAIVHAYLEGKRLRDFVDHGAISYATRMYSGQVTPLSDLRDTQRVINDNWQRYYRDQARLRSLPAINFNSN